MLPVGSLRRSRNAVLASLFFIAAWPLPACSQHHSSSREQSRQAFQAVKASAQEPVSEWAGEIAATAGREVQASGTYDFFGLISKSKDSAGKASDPLCAAIKKNPAVQATQQTPTGEQQLVALVDREMASAIGRFPEVLYAEKVVWPTSWLLDSSKPPTYEASAKEADRQFLKSTLAAKFVGPDGSFLAPTDASPDYPTLISWLRQTKNRFAGTVTSLTQPVASAVSNCLASK